MTSTDFDFAIKSKRGDLSLHSFSLCNSAMRQSIICQSALVAFVLFSALVATAYAGNDYLWGEVGPNDYQLAKDTVSKAFFVGMVLTKKYTFTQKDNLNALTITAVRVTDKKKSNGATAVLLSGGPGSKGATLRFTSERGYGIKSVVEIWGR